MSAAEQDRLAQLERRMDAVEDGVNASAPAEAGELVDGLRGRTEALELCMKKLESSATSAETWKRTNGRLRDLEEQAQRARNAQASLERRVQALEDDRHRGTLSAVVESLTRCRTCGDTGRTPDGRRCSWCRFGRTLATSPRPRPEGGAGLPPDELFRLAAEFDWVAAQAKGSSASAHRSCADALRRTLAAVSPPVRRECDG